MFSNSDTNKKTKKKTLTDAKYTGQKVKVTGWGTVAVNGATSKFLRETNLNVLSLDSCKNTSIGKHLTNSVICAYNDNTDACQV